MTDNTRYNPQIHHRRSIRLKGYDYSRTGAYFITICAYNRLCLFGEIIDGEMRANPCGETAAACWRDLPRHFETITLGDWVVMPNHIHGILVIGRGEASAVESLKKTNPMAADASPLRPNGTQSGSLGAIVQNYKSVAARRINILRGASGVPVWQRNYWEHIIRDEASYGDLTRYILNNPKQWTMDRLFAGAS